MRLHIAKPLLTVLVATTFSGVLCPTNAGAAVKLPGVFSDHMVLQRDKVLPVWGEATPDEEVTVRFRDQQLQTKANAQGKWQVKLAALKAGGPDELTIGGTNQVVIKDVLVGEVWVGSGQSNMQGGVNGYAKGDEVLAKLATGGPYPKIRLISGKGTWVETTPPNIERFSALLFAFGVRLEQQLDVPVGLILGAVGGTPSGAWLSEAALAEDSACQELIAQYSTAYPELIKGYETLVLPGWEKVVAAAKAEGSKEPNKPPAPAKPGVVLGQKPGYLFEQFLRPFVSYGIRGVLWDQGESGTALGGVDQYTLMGALIRGWRKEWEQGEFPFIYIQKPSGGGCAWDPKDPVTNRAESFVAQPERVPQTPAGMSIELHVRIMNYPQTAMAISSDLGSGIHPTNKSGYAKRAADVALGMVYGKPIEYYGPLYDSFTTEGDKLRIKFSHVGRGLAFRHGDKLQGFVVAGEDKTFHWADAVIDGNTVVLSSAQVAKPVAARYGWSQVHNWANLFNQDGLPAVTFRTDKW